MKRRAIALVVLIAFASSTAVVALDSKKAMYVGGTMTALVPESTEGRLVTTDADKLVFIPEKGTGTINVAFATIDSFEYGQKASHRIKTAILLTPWTLFSKKRRHYLSIMWKDEAGKDAGVVFELGKDLVRSTYMLLEARTGKKTTFESDDAKKNFAK